jgi:hypothetical protein
MCTCTGSRTRQTPDPEWSAIIGDCVHNLRTALDYLATQLVRVSGHTPNQKTMFPVMSRRPPSQSGLRRIFGRKAGRVLVHGGVRDDILQVVDSVQPYHGSRLGRHLWRLRELDVVDKHRQLLLVVTVPRAFGFDFNPALQPVSSLERTYTRLREITANHGEPIFKITFREPVQRLTPNLRPYPLIAFSRYEREVGGLDADLVLSELCIALESDIRSLFAPFFR